MTSIMRRTVRGTAAGLGALAIIAGAAACGGLTGGETETTTEPAVEEEKPAEDEGESDPAEEADPAETEEDGGDASTEEGESTDEGTDTEGDDASAGEAISEEDLTAVGDRYYEFLQAAAQSDGTAACTMIINPMTDEPMEGTVLEQCAIGFEGEAGEKDVDPSMLESLDRSMFEGVDNGDGTAGVSMMDQDAGMTFVKAEDGQWYIDGSDFI